MNRRLSGGDASLNATISADGGRGPRSGRTGSRTKTPTRPPIMPSATSFQVRSQLLDDAMDVSQRARRRTFSNSGRLKDAPVTLEELSGQYNVSRERISPDRGSCPSRSFRSAMKDLAKEKGMLTPA